MQSIKSLSIKELENKIISWGHRPFHAKQIYNWIYQKGAIQFSQMTDLSGALRKKLEEEFYLTELKIVKAVKSRDSTEKFLFELKDKSHVEAVLIPAENRTTGCISTQVGCKFSCSFCASGAVGFKRDLAVEEILDEAWFLKNESDGHKLTHLVYMGTGEPLDNYDNVLKSIRIVNSPDSFNIGARRLTISTSGIVPGIKRLSEEGLQVELSVSLHASDDKTRSRIMPVNRIYPLTELMSACREYFKKTNRQVTFEYILIKGLNSDLQSATNLGKILKGLDCKVNLIPANPIKELKVEPPGKLEILLFKDSLRKQGINVTLRVPRGQDIDAACGQLRLKHDKT